MIVVGSGAAGAAAALAAAGAGADVVLLERSEALGGTTTYSGSVSWLPANHRAAEAGVDDSEDDALTYLESLGLGDVDGALTDTFVRAARRVAETIESSTDLRWRVLPYPDYHAERPGGRTAGRSLEVEPLRVRDEVARAIRQPLHLPRPVTYAEIAGRSVDEAVLVRRESEGVLTMGRALVGGLVQALIDRGGSLLTRTRARALVLDSRGRVAGVETANGPLRGRVVLASGGFERNTRLVAAFLRGPMTAPTGAPTNEGDGLRMLLSAGAELGNMSEAWWCPAYRVADESYDGAPFYRAALTERSRPGSLVVDRRGVRFASEAQNYNDFGRALHEFDPSRFDFPRNPSWLIFDASYRTRYHFGPLRRDAPDPGWLTRAADLDSLADAVAIPARNLRRTVERFNAMAEGRDEDFGRGSFAYERFLADSSTPYPTLGPLEEAPFYAVRILPGCLGTKGGARTDGRGRVLHADGSGPIEGLYAAGNAAANPLGMAYPGAGGTLGPGLVFGTRAGEAAAQD